MLAVLEALDIGIRRTKIDAKSATAIKKNACVVMGHKLKLAMFRQELCFLLEAWLYLGIPGNSD